MLYPKMIDHFGVQAKLLLLNAIQRRSRVFEGRESILRKSFSYDREFIQSNIKHSTASKTLHNCRSPIVLHSRIGLPIILFLVLLLEGEREIWIPSAMSYHLVDKRRRGYQNQYHPTRPVARHVRERHAMRRCDDSFIHDILEFYQAPRFYLPYPSRHSRFSILIILTDMWSFSCRMLMIQ